MAKRNGMAGFFAGLEQGYDSTGRILQDMELNRISREKPTESQGFTTSDGEQLAAIANAKDENGNPYYTLAANEDGSYTVNSNFDTGGAAPAKISQGLVTDFMGQRTSGRMSQDQVDKARYGAMADVIGRNDPARGLQMRRQMRQDEQADTRFANEQTVFKQGQEDRAATKATESARKEYFKSLTNMDNETLLASARKEINASHLPMMVGFDPKTKRFMFASDMEGVPSQTLSKAELVQHMMGVWESGNGDFSRGIQMQLDTLDRQRKEEDRLYNRTADRAKMDADSYWRGRSANNADAALGVSRERLGLERARFERDQSQPVGMQNGFIVGPDGNLTPVVTGMRFGKNNSTLEPVVMPLPAARGFVPEGALTPAAIAKVAAQFEGQQVQDGLTGKPRAITPDEATNMARQAIIQNYTGQQAGNGINAKAVEASRAALRGGPGATPATTPRQAPPTGARGLSIPGAPPYQSVSDIADEVSRTPPQVDSSAVARLDAEIARLTPIAQQRPAYRAQLNQLIQERAKMVGS